MCRMQRLARSPWPFLALTLAWSWGCWGVMILTDLRMETFPGSLLFILGGGGPALAAVALSLADREMARRTEYWKRIVDARRIPAAWYAAIFLVAPLTALLAAGTRWLATGDLMDFSQALDLLSHPGGLISLAVVTFFFGPLPEEIGWRGFALDRLQTRHSGLAASLILAAVWALWHVPLFLIKGSYQHSIGFGTPGFWLFSASLLPESILMTLVFNHTRRSTLAAALFHFMTNFTGQFIPFEESFSLYRLVWALLIAAAALVIFGKNLSPRGNLRIWQVPAPPSD